MDLRGADPRPVLGARLVAGPMTAADEAIRKAKNSEPWCEWESYRSLEARYEKLRAEHAEMAALLARIVEPYSGDAQGLLDRADAEVAEARTLLARIRGEAE